MQEKPIGYMHKLSRGGLLRRSLIAALMDLSKTTGHGIGLGPAKGTEEKLLKKLRRGIKKKLEE